MEELQKTEGDKLKFTVEPNDVLYIDDFDTLFPLTNPVSGIYRRTENEKEMIRVFPIDARGWSGLPILGETGDTPSQQDVNIYINYQTRLHQRNRPIEAKIEETYGIAVTGPYIKLKEECKKLTIAMIDKIIFKTNVCNYQD
jgi:hypothetical protein